MRMNAGASATYKKLDDGTWGVWTDLDCRPGQTITVTTTKGRTRAEKLDKKLWTDGSISLWSLRQPEGDDDL